MATIISLLTAYNNDTGVRYSLSRLSNLLNIPVKTLREDLEQILNGSSGNRVYSLEYCDELEEETDDTLSPKTINENTDIYLSGYYNGNLELVLSAEEWTLLNDLLDGKLEVGMEKQKICWIKNSLNAYPEKYIRWMNDINESILLGTSIKFSYKTPKEGIINVCTRPVKLIQSVDDNLLYVVGFNDNIYRLDRIVGDISPSGERFELDGTVDYSKYDKMWGLENSNELVHIKLRIYKEAGSVARALKDLGKRAEGHITEYSDYVVYEDDIIGRNKFKSWVYGYGSSMVVEEPEDIRKEIISSIKARMEYYRNA